MAKGSGSVRVSRYYLSMFFGICAYGANIQLLEIKFGGKRAWRGNLTSNNSIYIDRDDLFGGERKEGGVRGILTWLNGNPGQTLPNRLVKLLNPNATPTTSVGYRGLAGIFLSGVPMPGTGDPTDIDDIAHTFTTTNIDSGRGFLVCANNPYLKALTARVRRPPQGLNKSKALIRIKDASDGHHQYAANFAHIIFEVMTNTDFGMGEDIGMIDIASFNQCADVLFNEKLCGNILWNRQSKIEDFIRVILDHIRGGVYINPLTGKHTLKLLRGDYQIGELKVVSPDNAKLSNFKTKAWGDISNEVVVTWTNPETGKEETVTVQDPAAIAAQGGVSSTNRNYHAVSEQATALMLAERDLASVAYPLGSCDAEVSRAFWATVVNDCVVLNWPRHGIVSSVYRVVGVTHGSSSNVVKLSLMEDVFAASSSIYTDVTDSEWINPASEPQPLINTMLGTAPAFMMTRALNLIDIGDLDYGEVIATIVAAPDSTDDIGADLVTYMTDTTGASVPVSIGQISLVGHFVTETALPREFTSTISYSGNLGYVPMVGSFLVFGSGTDSENEIALVTGTNGNEITFNRGVLDTVPRAWPLGTRCFVLPSNYTSVDKTRRSAGEEVDYHLKTVTSQGTLPLYNTPVQSVTLTDRPHLPYRPANVSISNTSDSDTSNNDPILINGSSGTINSKTITVSWSNRNRKTEATIPLAWNAASVAVEEGQFTEIIFKRKSDNVVVYTATNLTGTSVTIPIGSIRQTGNPTLIMSVYSVRDNLRCLQAYDIEIGFAVI